MNQITLPLSEIIQIDRQRQDMGDIEALAASIRRYGLLQPISVNQDKVLVDGGRRYAACKLLGLTHVDVFYQETASQADVHERELEANIRRKDMKWQEQCLAIAHVHKTHAREHALAGMTWSQGMTAELLGVSSGNVNYCLEVARNLADPKSPMWQCDSFREAWRLRLRNEEDAILAELKKREQQVTRTVEQIKEDNSVIEEVKKIRSLPALEYEQAKERYLTNPLNTIPFDEYWKERVASLEQRAKQAEQTIYLSNRIFLGDAITFMNDPAQAGMFDHVITDIPYGIDVDPMEIADVDTVANEHDVEENMALIAQFFPAAFACTKLTAFVATWCDQELWQYMKDLAIKAGFLVQDWPITWVKTSACQNGAAQYNFTKTTEIAMVCRKPRATLAQIGTRCDFQASSTDVRKLFRHPFAKPFECWDFLTNAICLEGQLVLEPFAGSGTGVVAMLRKKINVIAVEKQLGHYNNLLENVKSQYYLKQNPNYVFK